MKAILYVAMVLLITATSSLAERKPLEKKHREIKPGASEVLVPNPKRQDGYDLVIKEHAVTYNDTTGLYTYRYWKTDSTYYGRIFNNPIKVDELAVKSPNKEGLIGQTLAPGVLDADNTKEQFKAFLSIAEKWGWVSTDKKDTALVHISKGLDQKAFSLLKNELNPDHIGVEKEVAAFLEHLGKQQGVVDD